MKNALLALSCLLLAASPSLAGEELVYVSSTGASKVSCFVAGPGGKLTLRSALELVERPAAMALGPRGQRIYVACVKLVRSKRKRLREDWILTLKRGPQGALTIAGRQRVRDRYAYLRVSPDGRFLLTAAYGAGKVTVFPLRQGLCGPRQQVVKTEQTAHCVEFDPSGRFVFVPHTRPNKVYQFSYEPQTGRLSANTPPSALGPRADRSFHQPRHLRFHPTLPLAYTSNERGGGISRWAFDAKAGTLTLQQTLGSLPAKYQGRSAAAEVRLTPDGRFAFVSNRDQDKQQRDSLAAFALDAKGALKRIGTFPAPAFPRAFTVGRGGKVLYVAGQHTRFLVVLAIDPQRGALKQIQRVEVGERPSWVLRVSAP